MKLLVFLIIYFAVLCLLYWTAKTQKQSLRWIWFGVVLGPVFGLAAIIILLNKPGPAVEILKRSYLASILIGAAVGVLLIGFGWWIHKGSTNGEFVCHVNFIPGPILGIIFICAGIFVVIAGITGKLHKYS